MNPFLGLRSCRASRSDKAFVIPLSAPFEMPVNHHSFISVSLLYLVPCFTLSLTFHCNCHFLTTRCFQIIHRRSLLSFAFQAGCHISGCQSCCLTRWEVRRLLTPSVITLSTTFTAPLMPWSCCNFTLRLMQLDVADYKIATLSNCLVKIAAPLLNEDFITPPYRKPNQKNNNSLASGKSFFISQQRQVCCEYWFQLHRTRFSHSTCKMSCCFTSDMIQLILIPRLSPDKRQERRLNSIVADRFNPAALLFSYLNFVVSMLNAYLLISFTPFSRWRPTWGLSPFSPSSRTSQSFSSHFSGCSRSTLGRMF